MTRSLTVRRIHRVVSILFTLTVAANFAVMAVGTPPAWVIYAPLPLLFLLMATGLPLYAAPYLGRWRRMDRA